ncbi:MAG: hypothetical protein IJ561_08315 [Ruminococcus sp.]|nr:hypothetical protein [Ruminococcus sp.]
MNKPMAAGFITIIIGLVMLALTVSDAMGLFFGRTNIEKISFDGFEEGETVEGDLSFIVGRVGEIQTKKRFFKIPYKTVTSVMYVIVDNGGYVLLEAVDDTAALDELTAQTAAYLEGTSDRPAGSVSFTGKATEITDDELALAAVYFEGRHIETSSWQETTSLYVLVQIDKTAIIIQLCITGGLILIGVILLIIARRYTYGETVYVGEEPPAPEPSETAEASKESPEKPETAEEPPEDNEQ